MLNPRRAVAHAASAGREQLWVGDDLVTIIAPAALTGRAYSLCDNRQPVGHLGPPPHIHDDCGEGFYVLEGTIQFTRGEDKFTGRPGDFAYVPPGVVHTFRNVGDTPSRVLVLTTPGGLDEFFRVVGTPESRDPEIAVRDPRAVTQVDIDRLLANLAAFNMRLA